MHNQTPKDQQKGYGKKYIFYVKSMLLLLFKLLQFIAYMSNAEFTPKHFL